jgi:hypothetical protein
MTASFWFPGHSRAFEFPPFSWILILFNFYYFLLNIFVSIFVKIQLNELPPITFAPGFAYRPAGSMGIFIEPFQPQNTNSGPHGI